MMRRLFLLCLVILLGFSTSASASIASDTETWLQLRDTTSCYNFSLYRNFLNAHADWPEQNILRVQAEQALTDNPPDAGTIITWFKRFPPVGDNGKFLYVKALIAQGQSAEAQRYLNDIWSQGGFNSGQQDILMSAYARWLTPASHAQRLDNLLWAANTQRAEKALSYTSGTARLIGSARLSLQRYDSRSLTLVSSVPSSAQNDAGLLYDMARYYRQRGQDERAAMSLNKMRGDKTARAAMWWKERAILARRALERGDFQGAYALAAAHGHDQGAELADAEWLSGWLAVTRLNRPDKALQHFDRMYRNVKTPISIARAAYWAGIASTRLKQSANAAQWYRIAAAHMHTFYGQMAAYALGNADASYAAFFKRSTSVPGSNGLNQSMVQAAEYLYKKGREKERDIFLTALLNQNKDAPQKIISVARRLHSPKISLAAAKAAYEKGILISDALFPRMTVPHNGNVESALTLGIIRQESMFDPYAQSSARAMGLMQLLPTTAQHVARKNGLAHKNTAQLFNPHHNMVLGQAYLGSMLNRYNGDVPLAAAAYNAGPGNVDKWLGEMGDPAADKHSWIDWVERIPFYETRNYVQRVWESYQIYKYMNAAR